RKKPITPQSPAPAAYDSQIAAFGGERRAPISGWAEIQAGFLAWIDRHVRLKKRGEAKPNSSTTKLMSRIRARAVSIVIIFSLSGFRAGGGPERGFDLVA